MKPKTLSRIKKFTIGTLMLGMAAIQPMTPLPDNTPLNTVVTAEAAATTPKLNQTKLTLNKGKSYTLKLTGTTQKVKWSSSKKSVATVSSKGKITAKKKGTATITAKVGSKKYTCKVTVKQPVTSVKLNKKSYTLKKTGAAVTLKATVKPTNANNRKVQWTTSNKNVATVNAKGKVTAIGSGTVTITATATDGSKKKASCKVTVKIPGSPAKPATPQPTPQPVHTHSYTVKVTKAATCTTAGIKTYSCSCGSSYTEAIPATGHSYTAMITKAAACDATGVKTYTCSRCGNSYTETIPATGNHAWIHHDTEGHYETVIVQDAWDETIYETHAICNTCGEDFGPGNAGADAAGEHGIDSGHGNYSSKRVAVDTVHHEAVTEQQWVETKAAYDQCSVCGATK